jgi:ferric-dicitrate binding protein FerR (iron transport regulator)
MKVVNERTRRIEKQAADWIARIEDAGADEAVIAARDAWLAQSDVNRITYLRMAWTLQCAQQLLQSRSRQWAVDAAGEEAQRTSESAGSTTQGVWPMEPAAMEYVGCQKPREGGRLLQTVACSLVLLGGLLLAVSPALRGRAMLVYNSAFHGAATAERPVLLSDGSEIELGNDGKVDVQFSPVERKVRLISGQAHFSVAHDPARPFKVLAGHSIVRAVGTRFTVRVLGTFDVVVNVEQGRVAIDCNIGDDAKLNRSDCNSLLEAGDRAEIRSGHVELTKAAPADPATHVAATPVPLPRSGTLVFQGETLEKAVAEINQLGDDRFLVVDAAIAQRRVGGVMFLQPQPFESFVAVLRRMGIRAEQSARDPREIDLRPAD